jgi:hypothetical protein
MIFLIIFGVGLLLLLVTFAIGELFDLGDGGHDAGHELGDNPSPFSSRILFVFVTAFGGFGFIGQAADWPTWASVTFAVGGGLAVAAGTFFLVVLPMARQQGSVHVREADFLDLEGQVIIEIPEQGVGRVSFVHPGSGARVAQAARSADGQRIPGGTRVRVVDVGANAVSVVVAEARSGTSQA